MPGSCLRSCQPDPLLSGYSLLSSGEPKELVWEEKAPVSVARIAYDGVEVLEVKIYFLEVRMAQC